MSRLATTISIVLLLLAAHAWAQEKVARSDAVSGVIRQVTLYREKALVTREIPFPAGEQLKEIEVSELPERTIADSVSASGDKRTTIRAVRVSRRPVTQSVRESVRDLDRKFEELRRQRVTIQHAIDVVTQHLETLSQLINFSGTAVRSDLERGVLQADSLTQLANFSMAQRRALSDEQFAAQRQLEDVMKQIEEVESQRNQLTSVRQREAFQARILLETEDGAAGTVRLSYLVSGCSWSPQYIVRGRSGDTRFDLHYGALIQQMSGEAWQHVQLVLSTASPAVNAAGPQLTPLRIAIVARTAGGQMEASPGANADPFGPGVPGDMSSLLPSDSAQAYAEVLPSLFQQQRDAEAGGESGSSHTAEDRDGELNQLAEKVQQIELQIEPSTWRALAPDAGDAVASQVYTLAKPVSLDTRREQQLVQVLETQLAGEMYHVATPLLSTYAYREARMTNSQPAGLLGGPATIYLDDTFVGRTQLPSTASGQSLTIGFGADQQVRTRRELMSKQDDIKGGNRRLTFSYRLVLNNFKSQPISLRLLDRMPITLAPGQLTVQLETPQQPLSADQLYQRMQRPTGLLRWDLDVPPHRHGSQAFDLHYRYELEFDRNRMPTTQHLLADILADFEGEAMPGAAGGGGFGGGGLGMPGTGR